MKTRIAPSPTGDPHVGTAYQALYNYVFAKQHGGAFIVRIEDTDRARFNPESQTRILEMLTWLSLQPDESPVVGGPSAPYIQTERAALHQGYAAALLESGAAYRAFDTAAELEQRRKASEAAKSSYRGYDRRDRDLPQAESDARATAGEPFVVRLKAPLEGSVVVKDVLRGDVVFQASELDDKVLLKADGLPTYHLAAMCDDHDMGVTHVIRGDDHLNNAFRQLPIIRAMNALEGHWPDPVYAHIPLIHGSDGAKLSKRHGALGVEAYHDEFGILPEALFNYLLRLGWGHGDREEITRDEAVELFDLGGVGKSPSRFDMKKLESLNGHYLREADDARLAALVATRIGDDADEALLTQAMPVLKVRAKNLNEVVEGAGFLFAKRPIEMTEKAAQLLEGDAGVILRKIHAGLAGENDWTSEALEATTKALAEELGLGLGKLAQPMRAALTGTTTSPGIFDVLVLLGRDEALARLDAQAA